MNKFIPTKVFVKQTHTNKASIIGKSRFSSKLIPKKLQPIKVTIHMNYVRQYENNNMIYVFSMISLSLYIYIYIYILCMYLVTHIYI